MRQSNFLEELQNFAALQASLTTSFRKAYPLVKDLESMLDAPTSGCVDTGKELFLFKRHGVGLAFKNWDGVTVDIHKHFGTPGVFDAWRIVQYMESTRRVDDDEVSEVDFDQVESELSQLADSGKLVRCFEWMYRFA